MPISFDEMGEKLKSIDAAWKGVSVEELAMSMQVSDKPERNLDIVKISKNTFSLLKCFIGLITLYKDELDDMSKDVEHLYEVVTRYTPENLKVINVEKLEITAMLTLYDEMSLLIRNISLEQMSKVLGAVEKDWVLNPISTIAEKEQLDMDIINTSKTIFNSLKLLVNVGTLKKDTLGEDDFINIKNLYDLAIMHSPKKLKEITLDIDGLHNLDGKLNGLVKRLG